LPFKRPIPKKSFSVNKVNQLFASIYTFLLIAVVSEGLVNGFGQLEFLNPLVFYVSVAILLFLVAAFVVSHFVFQSPMVWARAIPIFTLILLATWHLHFDSSVLLPETFKPWIWWLLGVSAIAAGTSFPLLPGVTYVLVACLAWVVLRVSPAGGSADLLFAVQDALHLLVLSFIGIAMVLVLRWQAAKTDFANQQLITSRVKSAQSQAVSLEQTRLDALVHDSVLTSLLVASKAKTPAEISLAAKSATEAIQRLDADNSSGETSGPITQVSFFGALQNRIQEVDPGVEIAIGQTNDVEVMQEVSEALLEATLQAVDNSIKHSGPASRRRVSLQSSGGGLKIVISDNGRGFRPSRVSKSRLGIQISIIGRVKSVGGRVYIRSEPGKGTDVVLEWAPNV
jgi:signal transduction histidine kinase